MFYFSQDLLHTVFQNGLILKTYTFDEVRDNAKLKDSELDSLDNWDGHLNYTTQRALNNYLLLEPWLEKIQKDLNPDLTW